MLSTVCQLVQISFQIERYEREKLPALILPVILWEVTDCCIKFSCSQWNMVKEVCWLFAACDTLPALMFVHIETCDFQVFSYILSFLLMQVIYQVIRTVVAYLLRPLISLSYCSWLAYSTVKSKIIKSSDQHLTIWLLYCTFWFKSINDFVFYSCQKTTHLL